MGAISTALGVVFLFLLAILIGVIPDLIFAAFVQWFGQWTGIQYLADASFWQAFWLAVLGSVLVGSASATAKSA